MGEREELEESRFETLPLDLEATKPPNTSQLWLFLLNFPLQTATLRVVGKMALICTASVINLSRIRNHFLKIYVSFPGKGSDCHFRVMW